jgi:hypothetical protein
MDNTTQSTLPQENNQNAHSTQKPSQVDEILKKLLLARKYYFIYHI